MAKVASISRGQTPLKLIQILAATSLKMKRLKRAHLTRSNAKFKIIWSNTRKDRSLRWCSKVQKNWRILLRRMMIWTRSRRKNLGHYLKKVGQKKGRKKKYKTISNQCKASPRIKHPKVAYQSHIQEKRRLIWNWRKNKKSWLHYKWKPKCLKNRYRELKPQTKELWTSKGC